MGREDEYFWKTAKERDSNPVKSSVLTSLEEKTDGQQPESRQEH